eukprot:6209012-Pleurochrysis_carterae.AAC.3
MGSSKISLRFSGVCSHMRSSQTFASYARQVSCRRDTKERNPRAKGHSFMDTQNGDETLPAATPEAKTTLLIRTKGFSNIPSPFQQQPQYHELQPDATSPLSQLH